MRALESGQATTFFVAISGNAPSTFSPPIPTIALVPAQELPATPSSAALPSQRSNVDYPALDPTFNLDQPIKPAPLGISFSSSNTDSRAWRYASFYVAGLDESAITADTLFPKPTYDLQPYEQHPHALSPNVYNTPCREPWRQQPVLLASPGPMPSHANNQHGGSLFSNASHPASPGVEQLVSSGIPQDRKRKRPSEAASDGGEPYGDEPTGDGSDSGPRERYWACPFFRRNENSNLSCLRLELKRIVDVRQHIKRHHMPIRCPRCHDLFQSKKERDTHVRLRQCRASDASASNEADDGAWDSIAMRGMAERGSNSDERRWYRIWEILFPNSPHPESPYIGQEFSERLERARNSFFSDNDAFKLLVDSFPEEARGSLKLFLPRAIDGFIDYAQRQNTVAATSAISPGAPRISLSPSGTFGPVGPQPNPPGFPWLPPSGPFAFPLHAGGYPVTMVPHMEVFPSVRPYGHVQGIQNPIQNVHGQTLFDNTVLGFCYSADSGQSDFDAPHQGRDT